ncbi:hypothetical protein OH807_04590 [Kitasatospora sp. NBC_01560]|uniref:hypothetical protein n=1 Tax=Kitasatospora sp. NBC_01560 TaxID=2975965 RepID=UPI00386C8AC0
MDCEEVMLTVRTTAAERALLRELARGHGSDVSEVAADGLLDVVPALPGAGAEAVRLQGVLARPAPCAVTLWLPLPLVDLLPLLGDRVARATGLPACPAGAALAAALRYWLAGDPARLAAALATMHAPGTRRAAFPPMVHRSVSRPVPRPAPRPAALLTARSAARPVPQRVPQPVPQPVPRTVGPAVPPLVVAA